MSWQARVIQVALLAIAVVGVSIAGHSVFIAFRDMYVFPFWDMISIQAAYFHFNWYDFLFFNRDNEHLPFLAMPLFAADNLLFAARGTFLVGTILALTAAMAALTIVELRYYRGRTDLALLAAAGATVAVFFWLLHYENLIWPKQVHMYLSAFFTLLAGRHTATLELRHRQGDDLGLRSAMVLGALLIAATFSFAYGVIAWVVVLILAVTGHWPRRALGGLFGLFALTAVLYTVRYNYAVPHTSPLQVLGDPLGFALYVVHYLAHPVVALLDTILTHRTAVYVGFGVAAAGVVATTLFIVHTLLVLRAGATRTDIFAGFLLLFAMGTAVMTGFGRLPFGVEQGHMSRYAIVQVLFWFGLCLAGAKAVRRRDRHADATLVLTGAAMLALLVPSQITYAATVEGLLRAHWQSVLAIVNGVRDDTELLAHIHPYREMIEDTAQNLAARRWSVYADPQPHWLGRPAAELFRMESAGRCLGAWDVVSDLGRLQEQSFVTGWAWDVAAARPATWVVLVDIGGKVRGLARAAWERLDVQAVYPQTAGTTTGWRGYVAAPVPLPGIQAYAVLANDTALCLLPRTPPIQGGSHG